MQKRWRNIWIPTVLTALTLTGCGTAAAQTTQSTNSMNSTNNAMASQGTANSSSAAMGNSSNSMGSTSSSASTGKKLTTSVGTPLMTSDILVGAAASPAMGAGNGEFLFADIGKGTATTLPLSSGANAFQMAISGNTAYVPTLQGQTYVINLPSRMVTGHFATPSGARSANLANQGKLLLITGSTSVTAYSLPTHQQVWTLGLGGNTLAVANGYAYLSGNASTTTAVIDLATGKQTATIAVGHIENSVYDKQTHTLWLADWMNGDMTVVNTHNNQVVKTIQKAEGGGFNMNNMMGSKGGFMQLAVSPNGSDVYAASFSGNIMVYNAKTDAFAKDIPVGATAKLSGLAVDPAGKYLYATVENAKETVAVSIQTGKVVSTMPGVVSNRWAVIHN